MAIRWRADDGPTLNTGLVSLSRNFFAKEPYIFLIFPGAATCPPSVSAHVVLFVKVAQYVSNVMQGTCII